MTEQQKPNLAPEQINNFKLTRSKIREMYKDDQSVRRNVNKTTTPSTNFGTLSLESLEANFYNLTVDLQTQRKNSADAYVFSPIYANIIDYYSNMFYWRYTYIPRKVKEKVNAADYAEMYALMGEVVEGICPETTFPMILTELMISGAVFLLTTKNTASKTITTLKLPYKYCRPTSISQYGTVIYQFDLSYFDSLGLSKTELEEIFNFYPKELKLLYSEYLTDKQNKRWRVLDPKYAGALIVNENGFPTRLRTLFSILRYEQYSENELARNSQQLDKIITHKMPTWEDKLVVGIEEMTELHASMAKVLTKNKHIRLLTSFGDIDVKSIGEDQTKENKTLNNAYNAIYDNSGLNHELFNGSQALEMAHLRDKSTIWKYVQEIVNFYNMVINNSFNFRGFQCDFNILPITFYDEKEMLEHYKNGATLGVSKLEYIVASGVKQIDIESKFELENFLQLDKLKPLSTSYTQNDNSKKEEIKSEDKEEDDVKNIQTEQEVEENV